MLRLAPITPVIVKLVYVSEPDQTHQDLQLQWLARKSAKLLTSTSRVRKKKLDVNQNLILCTALQDHGCFTESITGKIRTKFTFVLLLVTCQFKGN